MLDVRSTGGSGSGSEEVEDREGGSASDAGGADGASSDTAVAEGSAGARYLKRFLGMQ